MGSTLQGASGGRFTLGIGIGGGAREHRAYGLDFPDVSERVARLEDAVAVIRALWSGGPVTRESAFYPLDEARAFPRPEPAPRILVGGAKPGGVRLAARIGDGWAAESPSFEAEIGRYVDALAEAGRERREAWVAVGIGGGKTGVDALARSPWIEAPRETWDRYRELGADEMVLTARTPRDIDLLVGAVDRW
jgi:alkanesulfonate monooxygenase SsuD/methylene tetrahydromethanopterin reductase-like flavin-dependent oxidoreductase (luciferase family)